MITSFDIYENKDLREKFDKKAVNFVIKSFDHAMTKKIDDLVGSTVPMLVLSVLVTSADEQIIVKDYVTLKGKAIFKFRDLMYSLGFEDQYKLGSFDDEKLILAKGKCETMVETSEFDGNDYVKIKKYISINKVDNAPVENSLPNDEIPF